MRRGRRLARLAGLFVAAVAALAVVRLTGCAESLAYWPTRNETLTPPRHESVWFETDDGLRLHAWFMRAQDAEPGEKRPTILHLHGNARQLDDHAPDSEFLTSRGFHVLIFDYRGYGMSDKRGPLRRDDVLIDCHAALDTLLVRDDVETDRIGALGISLGGAFAQRLTAQRDEIRAVCTIATFPTWKGVAGDFVPLIGPLVFPNGWDPIDTVGRIPPRPWLIVHGDRDRTIRPRHGDRLFDEATTAGIDATLRVVEGAGHNDVVAAHPEVRDEIAVFFREHLTPEEPSEGD